MPGCRWCSLAWGASSLNLGWSWCKRDILIRVARRGKLCQPCASAITRTLTFILDLLRFLGVHGFPGVPLAADDRKSLCFDELAYASLLPCSMLKALVSRCQVVRRVNGESFGYPARTLGSAGYIVCETTLGRSVPFGPSVPHPSH
ncbi:hypothetical protein B0H13DRAFT_145236 [Mycena leptocephala]|nr:hypothetical protein B0H13DRAFT_145236 [Mycena leptocephala]